jgi:putative hydrolase of the HAD superfamily
VSDAELAQLIAGDVESWAHYRHEVWTRAEAFHASGGRTAFLSNRGPEVMARVRADHPLEARFDVVIISCEVGLSKPDPRIYRFCLKPLGLAPGTLFVDDRARLGLRRLQFESPDSLDRLRALLRQTQRTRRAS